MATERITVKLQIGVRYQIFRIDYIQNSGENFQRLLHSNVRKLVGNDDDSFNIGWKDTEGDLITIGSEDEFVTVVENRTDPDGYMRLILIEDPATKRKRTTAAIVHHM